VSNRVGAFLILLGIILLAIASWRQDGLPNHLRLRPELLNEPKQVERRKPPIVTTVGGIEYQIQPLYSYDLYGLVVSRHDSAAWWDSIHRDWNDKLNVADLCVVWGNNAKSGAYEEISFSSGQFVCNYSSGSSSEFAEFDQTAVSNNHLLTDDPAVARQIAAAHVGDQVHFRGYLAEYSHNHGFAFKRGTSTVRTDSGNGACETVLVEDFEILERGSGFWRSAFWLAVVLIGLGLVGWFVLPVRNR
jgi:hypothetical protein